MRRYPHKGFTLAEVLVASTISAFVALVAVGALKAVSDSAELVNRIGETTTEVGFAARLLARDLANLYRDPDPRSMRLIGASQGSDNAPSAFLRFYTVGRAPARVGQPEGDVYEVEYLLKESLGSETASDEQGHSTALLRRLWPNPDTDREPGGMLVSIAQNIDVFQLRFFDGQQWTNDWPEEMQSLPQLIEVTLAILGQEGSAPTMETFTVNFARLATGSAAPPSGAPGGPGQPGQQQQNPSGSGPPAQSGEGPGGSR